MRKKFDTSIKKELLAALEIQISRQITTAQSAINSAQEAKAQETKSTAGDKHEVGRAMMQIEQEKNEMQLAKAKLLQSVLSLIDPEETATIVGLGSLVSTNLGTFFISIGLGKVLLNDQEFMAISREAPLAQLLLGKSQTWNGQFRNREITIEDIC